MSDHENRDTSDEPLYWHCASCGAHEPVEPTGSSDPADAYEHGDHEPCITCPNGTARVMTLREAACIESRHARGLPPGAPWPVGS